MIPSTLEESIICLMKELPFVIHTRISKMSEKDLDKLSPGLGTKISDDWKLWSNGPLVDFFRSLGINRPADMSAIIIKSFWRTLKKEPIDLESQIRNYQISREDNEKQK